MAETKKACIGAFLQWVNGVESQPSQQLLFSGSKTADFNSQGIANTVGPTHHEAALVEFLLACLPALSQGIYL